MIPLKQRGKRKVSNQKGELDLGEIERERGVNIAHVRVTIDKWVNKVKSLMVDEDHGLEGWDDAHVRGLPAKLVKEARKEEVGYMKERGIWENRPVEEC